MTMLHSNLVAVAAAVADGTRLRLLVVLGDGPMTVGALSVTLGIAQSSTSYHVGRLEAVGLVLARRRGRSTVVHRNHRRWMQVVQAFDGFGL